jgi:hypothetical protein
MWAVGADVQGDIYDDRLVIYARAMFFQNRFSGRLLNISSILHLSSLLTQSLKGFDIRPHKREKSFS